VIFSGTIHDFPCDTPTLPRWRGGGLVLFKAKAGGGDVSGTIHNLCMVFRAPYTT
jgi:hypothetical protein